jgi:uroporphyrinogen-III synthase
VTTVSTAIEKLITADNKQKLQAVFAAAMPLVQGSVTVSKVEALLEAATGLSKEEVLGMVGRAAKPLVQRKLEELGVQPEDVTTVSTAIEKLITADNKQKLQAVFAAAMPLVQGSVTVSKVEALLEAVDIEPEEVLGMVGRAAKPLVQRKLEELGVQPEDVTTVSTVKTRTDALKASTEEQLVTTSTNPAPST